jgi:hypothetical protein
MVPVEAEGRAGVMVREEAEQRAWHLWGGPRRFPFGSGRTARSMTVYGTGARARIAFIESESGT